MAESESRSKSFAPLSFAELVDLECLLSADADADPGDLLRRDGELGEGIGAGRETDDRHELFRRWIAAREQGAGPSPGERVFAYYRLVGWLAAGTALFAGGGTAATLLHYDGRDPVNILGFLAVFVGLQVALVALSLLLMVPRTLLGRLPALGGISEFIRQLGYRRAGVDEAVRKMRGKLGDGNAWIGRLVARQAVYAGVERWMLTALTQRTGVFFNLGALIATVYLLSVRALAFAWSTTLTLDTATMTRWLHVLATPWRWLPAAVPNESLVAASRYFPGTTYDTDRLGDWWPFLVAALVCYGLLPRTVLALFAAYRARRARRGLTLDHGEAEALYDRLMRRSRGWTGTTAPDPVRYDAVAGEFHSSGLPSSGTSCVVFAWAGAAREAVVTTVERRFGWRPERVEEVDGSGSDEERALLAQLGDDAAAMPVAIGAEAWEPPSKGLMQFLRDLRAETGPTRPLVVVLIAAVGESGETASQSLELDLWRGRLAVLGDAYLRVEAGLEP